VDKPGDKTDTSQMGAVPAPTGSMMETVPSNISVGDISIEPAKKPKK
jgi:hypothetical protein